MTAIANYASDKGFVINEEGIRKINDILVRRGQNLQISSMPVYKIRRSDFFSYETSDIQDLLKEENSQTQKIEMLTVEMTSGDEISVYLKFEQDTQLKVSGTDRDKVFLIFSDLKQYLQSDINSTVGSSTLQNIFSLQNFILIFFIMMITWITFVDIRYQSISRRNDEKYNEAYKAYSTQVAEYEKSLEEKKMEEQKASDEAISTAIASNSTDEKLNFVIQQYQSKPSQEIDDPNYPDFPETESSESWFDQMFSRISFLAIIGLTLTLLWLGAKWVSRLFFSRNLFLIGKEIGRNARRNSIKDKILWGIVIAFVVGILSSIAVLIMFQN